MVARIMPSVGRYMRFHPPGYLRTATKPGSTSGIRLRQGYGGTGALKRLQSKRFANGHAMEDSVDRGLVSDERQGAGALVRLRGRWDGTVEVRSCAVAYTHLTLPTIYS